MDISALELGPAAKISRIINVLESTYGLTVDLSAPINELISVYDECKAYTTTVMETSTMGSDPEYGKAMLIQESIRLFLSEIAPKRIKKKKTD